MYKFILILSIILSSCAGTKKVVIQEEDIKSGDYNVLDENFRERNFAKQDSNNEFRNALVKINESFQSEDIENATDADLIASGVRSYSSDYAKTIIAELKDNDPELTFVIYFDFDSDKLKNEAVTTIVKHKEILEKYPALKVRLEGHTDPKGSREYNLALGELRALSVRKDLLPTADFVSFGEEKLVSADDDSKNRRVEIIYK